MTETTPSTHFIRNIIEDDLKSGKHTHIATRFPPEPNGYLHVGHAKSICLNFGLAQEYRGQCNLRFDDTNPTTESTEYVESIKDAVHWLGFDWEERLYHASDYFQQLYEYAVFLIKQGKAYVCSLTQDEIREYRGTLKQPGKDSPYRNRSVEENLDLFERMKNGEFPDGKHVLRAKIDMASPNINMRDPAIYRIRNAHHHRTGDDWRIYPMYDFTHCLSDAIEGITHSLCTLEFEDHRPLYDWVLDECKTESHPQQIEFSRLNLKYTITSKRKLNRLVEENHVTGWNDPRMPTIVGMRRRGYTSASLRNFCERVGISKSEYFAEMTLLEDCVREDLDATAPRRMCVLHPLKVVITNYPEGKTEDLTVKNHPKDPEMGTRSVPFSKVVYIEQEDFREDPPKKYHRLSPNREVRLRNAYVIRCDEVIKDPDTQEIVELRCTYFPETKGGQPLAEGKKVKGIIHWVSAEHANSIEVRLYDRLFSVPNPNEDKERDFTEFLNPNSLEVLTEAKAEPSLKTASPEVRYQFERQGYFTLDSDSTPDHFVFNRIVTLRDSWAKIEQDQQKL